MSLRHLLTMTAGLPTDDPWGDRQQGMPLEELRRRAEELAKNIAELPGVEQARPVEDVAFAGGGSLPDQKMKTWVVEVTVSSGASCGPLSTTR